MKKKFTLQQLIVITVWFSLFFPSCENIPPKFTEPGVSLELAQLRNKQIQNIRYDITFSIPDSRHKQINGNVIIQFDFNKKSNHPLILDFRNQPSQIIK